MISLFCVACVKTFIPSTPVIFPIKHVIAEILRLIEFGKFSSAKVWQPRMIQIFGILRVTKADLGTFKLATIDV